jgi:hypothetical protein
MKASKGQEIVCDCARPAGRFRQDVANGVNISTDDIELDLPWTAVDDISRRVVCPTCKTEAARFVGDHWQVRTRSGWL